MKYLYIILLLGIFFLPISNIYGYVNTNGQSNLVQGTVLDKKTKQPIEFASVYIAEINLGYITDKNGKFQISTSYQGTIKISTSIIGYQPNQIEIFLPTDKEIIIYLQKSSYALSEIVVQSKELDNSVSRIEKAAMEHIQPSSFADLMQLLPGHSTKEIDMSESNFISMRQAGSDGNTSLGTAFIIDGSTQSNNANLQTFYGTSSDDVMTSRITTSKGTDLRTISTDKIESVEVIRGIPSAKYGDVTAGVVKIELKSGETPWEGRVKVDLKNKLCHIGKGLKLPDKKGLLNFDIDYASYKPDVRSNLTDYTRITSAIRYENKFELSKHSNILLKGNISYTGSFDNQKNDEEALFNNGYLKTKYNDFNTSLRGTLKTNKFFIREATLQTSLKVTSDIIDRYKLISLGGTTPLTSVSKEEGIWETGYLPAEYYTNLKIEGKPISWDISLAMKSELKTGQAFHSFGYGLEYNYDKNRGAGAIFDPQFPPYVSTKSARARAFNEVPAMQRFSMYLEDKINWKIGKSVLSLQPGLRITTLPGMSDNYKMNGKYYFEPRVNSKFTFPKFNIGEYNSSFSLTGGVGQLYKFPTLAQLYPDKIYSDYIQLNYYSLNPDYRFAVIKTFITDPTNYDLVPAKNMKYETGIVFVSGQIKADITFFREVMKNGFSSGNNNIAMHEYRYYNAEYIQNPTSKPSLDDFKQYTDEKVLSLYGKNLNDAGVEKTGIEYTINFGKISAIYTNISVNGAWFKTHYTYNGIRFYKPSVVIDDHPYPYVGVYNYNKSSSNNAEKKSQFNTNINFDTHVPLLRMIFSTSIQTMWYEMAQDDLNSAMPYAYIDNTGVWHEFTPDLANVTMFKYLVDINADHTFRLKRTALASTINLKLSKEIGNNIRLACYFNNILSYLPDYTDYRGVEVVNRSNSNSVNPYFGAEINIKF